MKIKLHHILLSFSLGLVSPPGINLVFAQDATMIYTEDDAPTIDLERERIIHSPGEPTDPNNAKSTNSVNANTHLPAKDSVVIKFPSKKNIRPTAADLMKREKPKEDDSIISFNFLYYIIQKYKLQDIIE